MKKLLFLVPLLAFLVIARAQIHPINGTGGNGMGTTNINTTSNGVFNLATNGATISGVATQLNLTRTLNIYYAATNSSDKVGMGIFLEPNITFDAGGGNSMTLGPNVSEGSIGFYNPSAGRWSMVLSNSAGSDDWWMPGLFSINDVRLRNPPGSGAFAAFGDNGLVVRTNLDDIYLQSSNNVRVAAGANVTVTPSGSGGIMTYTVASTGGGGGSGVTVSNANTLYVDAGGNDSTAVRGRPDLPYLRPFAAKTAAVAGDTIIVNKGTYQNCTNLLKGGVNWYGYGATLCHTNRTNDTGIGIFDDRFISAGVTSKIQGFSFIYSTGYETTNASYAPAHAPTNTLGCIVLTNSRSQVSIDFDRLDYQDVRSTPEYAGAIWLANGTNTFIRGNLIQDMNLTTNYSIGFDPDLSQDVSVESVAIGIYWTSGEHHLDIKRICCKLNSFYAGGAASDPGNCWLTSDYLMGQFYSAGSATQPNWRIWATVKEIEVNRTNATSPGAITFGFGGKLYLTAEKVTELGTEANPSGIAIQYLAASPTCEAWMNIQKVSATSQWINHQSGTLNATIQHFEDLGSVDKGIAVIGGMLRLNGLRAAVTNTTGSAFYHGSGDSYIEGMRISATNSSASPIILGTNGAVFASCSFISKSGVFSLFSTNAQNANIQSCWGRTDETNVTYNVGPWTVSSSVQ